MSSPCNVVPLFPKEPEVAAEMATAVNIFLRAAVINALNQLGPASFAEVQAIVLDEIDTQARLAGVAPLPPEAS